MRTKLTRIAELAKQRPRIKLQTLIHVIDEESLKVAHSCMQMNKATGIDAITKEEYGEKLEENLTDLLDRMKRQGYKPQPVKRVCIPKADGKKRPLGIPAYEDKLVQKVLNEILTAIYEEEFLECSYGFRPGKSCHDALKELANIVITKKVNYVVDADIKGFFDNVSHSWMMKFLQERIEDRNLLRLIQRFLKAGVIEAGIEYETDKGTPQGGIISPTLANVYLHYVLDLWFTVKIKKESRGEAYLVRYADDFVCFFQYQTDAESFYGKLIDRLKKFNLEIAKEKTKVIEFGRFSADNRARREESKPNTFDFLGFTHYCSKSKTGKFRVKRKTSRKKMKAKLKDFTKWLHNNMHTEVGELIKQVNAKLVGHFRYYGVTDNSKGINTYRYRIRRKLFEVLNRRSQKKSLTWEGFIKLENRFPLAKARTYVNIYG
ncbi:group II intron reverse transcriptase/maturase [Sporomusa malonica]|uniref:Group II intron reverse transcriptase/maturase n=1 Tax=Sporomusa malonica TaxID=112901 RepID=A0A1W1YYW5_9FIRM|nr:group II intron reverse transcriptase/maturase [Sporomusa malonica]SMC41334.1 group II intron reverse transcriptase/maturase [Sporomusa malonica]